MCYNIRIDMTRDEIAKYFQLEALQSWEGPTQRVTLGQSLPAATADGSGTRLELLYWGFTPRWTTHPKGGHRPGNARAETVAETPMFRDAFARRRCVVPATGFYEWIGEKGSKLLLPFTVADLPVFGLPGVWDEWQMPGGKLRRSCAILTCDPSGDVRPYHDRMPVILDQPDALAWLSPDATPNELRSLLQPYQEGSLKSFPDQAFKP